jgi:succinate dehydrogenase / fumarate reductase flavoprotein subunit
MALDSKVPKGPIKDKWTDYKNKINLVNPANKRHIDVIVVGTGLAGGSASATLAELGYNVKSFAYQDSPRRAHSIAAQGGINAAKKLPRRWRFYLQIVLRYCKGRRLPFS